MQRWVSGNQRLDDADVVQNAGCGSITNHRFDIFCRDAVNYALHRTTGCGSVDEVDIMAILDRDSGRVSQPFRIVERAALGDGRTTLLPRKPRVKRRIQKENTHCTKSI